MKLVYNVRKIAGMQLYRCPTHRPGCPLHGWQSFGPEWESLMASWSTIIRPQRHINRDRERRSLVCLKKGNDSRSGSTAVSITNDPSHNSRKDGNENDDNDNNSEFDTLSSCFLSPHEVWLGILDSVGFYPCCHYWSLWASVQWSSRRYYNGAGRCRLFSDRDEAWLMICCRWGCRLWMWYIRSCWGRVGGAGNWNSRLYCARRLGLCVVFVRRLSVLEFVRRRPFVCASGERSRDERCSSFSFTLLEGVFSVRIGTKMKHAP